MEDLRAEARVSLTRGSNNWSCICETLRTIYDSIHSLEDLTLKESITEKLVDAFIMAKKMNGRLVYYVDTYEDGPTPNDDSKLIKDRFRISVMRKEREL